MSGRDQGGAGAWVEPWGRSKLQLQVKDFFWVGEAWRQKLS